MESKEEDTILFFRETEIYGELCNFYKMKQPIKFKDKLYPTSEHLYQSLKYIYQDAPTINNEYSNLIRTANTPNKSKMLANQVSPNIHPWQKELNLTIKKYQLLGIKIKSNWEYQKESIMLEILRIKFTNDQHCKKILLSTGNKKLVEASPYDDYWGTGSKRTGKNILGKLLMQVRRELTNQ